MTYRTAPQSNPRWNRPRKIAQGNLIYLFNEKVDGVLLPYVGQSGNGRGRLLTHIRKGKYAGGEILVKAAGNNKLLRELAERSRIREFTGGRNVRASDAVANLVSPISDARYALLKREGKI